MTWRDVLLILMIAVCIVNVVTDGYVESNEDADYEEKD
jgi:hypothetical protein